MNMNRRQFLGRFFQAVISANNSNSTYGIYHPWRQYNEVLYSVTIYLQSAFVNKSGEITYNSVPSMSLRNTVIAVYDSNDAMIYCSAYKYNGNINNNLNNSIILYNMPAGTYKIKCLQYGIGLEESMLGNELEFVVPEPADRSSLPNNNYGQISSPNISVQYLFGISGLYFTAESKLESVGRYFYENQNINSWKIECKAPSYDSCETIYNTTAESVGVSSRYSQRDYMFDMTRENPPITDEYRFRFGDRYQLISKIKAIFVSNGQETNITTIDLKDYVSEGAVKAAEYWKVCDYNNIAYDPDTYYEDQYGIGWDLQISGITSTDGSYEAYTFMTAFCGIINPKKDCNVVVMGGGRAYNGISNSDTDFNYQINNVRMTMPVTYPQATINGKKYYSSSMMWLNITTELNLDRYMYGSQALQKEIYSRGSKWEDTPKEQYENNLPKVAEHRNAFYDKYLQSAFDHYHIDPNDDVPWIKSITKQYEYKYPISAMFGKLTDDKSKYPIIIPPTSSDIPEPIAILTGGDNGLYWGLDAYNVLINEQEERKELRPMLKGYTANLSEYDPNNQCDNPSMWVNYNDNVIFLRQNIIEIDIESIPNNRISH